MSAPLQLAIVEEAGVRFVTGPPGLPLMRGIEDAGLVLEACFAAGVSAALLFGSNLKVRTYGIRLAVVCPPGSESCEAARDWLTG
jgi:hypothetical protein